MMLPLLLNLAAAAAADPTIPATQASAPVTPQVRMIFETSEAAVAYCDKHGLQYHLVAAPPVRLKIQAYADNFR